MKTKSQNQKIGAQSRPEQVSTAKRTPIDFAKRKVNRSLKTEKLLALMQSDTPSFFELAEVVGKWVWVRFTDKQPPEVTRILAELGFHWSNLRQAATENRSP